MHLEIKETFPASLLLPYKWLKLINLVHSTRREKDCQGLRKESNPEIPDTVINQRNITLVLCA